MHVLSCIPANPALEHGCAVQDYRFVRSLSFPFLLCAGGQ